MGARRGGRLAAAAAVVGCAAGLSFAARPARVAAQGAEDPCELSRVTDRARTPSQRCLSCHDGSTGAGTVFDMRRGAPQFAMSHPVEVDYAEVAARAAGRYVPPSLLPRLVPLVDGKVACTSCHDGASGFAKHVVDPQRLCYACHRL